MLIEDGHTVVGIDNMNDAYDVRMKEYRLKQLQAMPGFTFHKLDISEQVHCGALQEQTIRRRHQSGCAGGRARQRGKSLDLCGNQCDRDAEYAGTLPAKRDQRNSSWPPPPVSMAKTRPIPRRKQLPADQPLQPYAASKKGAEALAHSYHYLHDLDVTIVRYFTVYGPAGRPDLALFRFTQWISEGRPVQVYGDGEQSRGFTYLDDIARGTIQALKPLGYEIINLGGHEVITINDLIRWWKSVIGKKAVVEYVPPNLADMRSNWADVSKAGDAGLGAAGGPA